MAGTHSLAALPLPPATAGAPPRDPGADLYKRVLWLTAFRVATVTVLVGVTAILTFRAGEPLAGRMAGMLSALAVATNVLQIGVALLLRRRAWLRALAVTQIAGDVGFACVLVYLTGAHESLFSFLYLLVIVNGSILLSHRGAWVAAGLSLAADWGQLLAIHLRILSTPPTAVGLRLSTPDLVQTLFVHAAAFALTATLSSYLAQLLERAGERASVAESSLSELHVLHDSIVRSIASGILTTDAEDHITYVNRAGEDIVELPLHAMRGRQLGELFPAVAEAIYLGRGRDHRLEAGWTGPGGTPRVLGFTVTPLVSPDGKRLGSAIVFQDLTSYRELELQAARSQRLAAVGKLAAGLAHELRNPLASISGSVELLASSAEEKPHEARLLNIVMREADRLSQLVSDFLAFARPAQPQLAAVDLPALVREVLHVFEADPHFSALRREEELQPAVARADASQLKQVLWNLLLNAAQATPAGGSLRVSTGAGEAGWVRVSVTDDGSGIAPEDMARIFDPFFTTKPEGTGLGLATVFRIVDAHQGRLDVESRPGEGSRFTVFLPAA